MVSAIVLCSDDVPRGRDAREVVVRSLAWLVSAVVAGVVRDVTIAVPSRFDLGEIADRVGCEIVHAEYEAERLRGSAEKARSSKILVVKAGYQPGDQLIEEIDARGGLPGDQQTAVMLAEPSTFLERLAPNLAPIVGVLASKEQVLGAESFAKLAQACKGGGRLVARARPLR